MPCRLRGDWLHKRKKYSKITFMQEKNDTQLVADYLNGDEQSLELLIERYMNQIYQFTYKYVCNEQEAQDISQEVFVRAWRNLKKFDQEKSFKTWIFAIARNASIDALKKKKTIHFSAFEDEFGDNALLETLRDDALVPHELSEQKGIAQICARAVAFLSPTFNTVLSLRYENDFTFAKISEILNEPLHTVKSRHRRALAALKKILSGLDFFH